MSRFLKGTAEPRLPDFFRMLNAATLRLLDFISVFVDPAKLPSVSAQWTQLQAARHAAYEMPLSHLVLRALELSDYRALPVHEPGWIAERVGISVEQEVEYLDVLTRSGQVIEDCGRLPLVEEQTAVDFGQGPHRETPGAVQRVHIDDLHLESELPLRRQGHRQGLQGTV